MAKILYAGCLGLFPAILVQFALEMCISAHSCEKFTKTPNFGGSRYSRSSMLTFLSSSSPVLVMISSMSEPICNYFHAKWANSSRMSFYGVPLFRPLIRGDPLTQQHESLSQNARGCRLLYGENPKSLSHLVLKRYRVMTDRQTDGQYHHS